MGKKLFLIIAGIFIAAILLISYIADLRTIRKKSENELIQTESIPDSGQDAKPLDPETGLAIGPGFNLVKTNCLGCHSGKLITQNKASRDTWKETILWMQETQNLWDLGENESKILDYLAKYYAPEQIGRRLPLQEIEWYELQE